MRLDELPGQLEVFLERARAVLDREIGAAKTAAAAANAEKAAAQTALRELVEQRESAKKQLDRVLADLARGQSLAGLNHEIATAKKTLEALKAEIERTTVAKAAVEKQITEANTRLVALGNEARRMSDIRSEAEATIASVRAKIYSVQLGNRP
jgi:predicted  nucleic acid-binding Zn-ribbon protein